MTEYPPPPPDNYPPPGDYPPPPPGNYPPPPGNYPPPGYPGSGAGYPPPGFGPTAGTNGLAIASLVSALAGLLCGIGSILGVVLGVIALNQIKTTGQQGRGLAIAGIAVGGALFAIVVIAWVVFAAGSF